MKFSVLIPVYYKENSKYLLESFNSIIKQTLIPNEIVIVKDGYLTYELDNVIDNFAKNYKKILKIVQLEESMGLGKALSIGLNNCSYETVARMDSDDICHPERFKKQIKFLEDRINVDIVGTWISEFVDNPKEIVSVRKIPLIHEEIYKFAKFRCPMNHMTVMFRKKSVLVVESYQHFPSFEDYYLWVRMLMNGVKFANIPESLVFARIGNNAIYRRKGIGYLKQEIKFHKRIFDIGFISLAGFLRNVMVRVPTRLLNAYFLRILYRKFIRN